MICDFTLLSAETIKRILEFVNHIGLKRDGAARMDTGNSLTPPKQFTNMGLEKQEINHDTLIELPDSFS